MGLAVVLGVVGASCFDGADALGLPCFADEDCGQEQRCEEGFCGGPPPNASTDASSTSSSSESSSESGSTASTSSDSHADTSTGPVGRCGDGVIDEELGEACDPGGVDDPACDADCSAVECGDGYPNAMAGEDCDDANDEVLDDCTPDCRATLFWDDIEQDPALTGRWLAPEIPTYDFEGVPYSLDEGWRWAVPDPGTWSSGPYSSSSGTARLLTRDIVFPADPGEGFRYELRLRHRLRFDGSAMDLGGCTDPQTTDGGVVWIREVGMLRPAGPPPEYPDAIESVACPENVVPEPDNPLYDSMMPRPAYSSSTGPSYVDTGFPLPADVAGKTVNLVFEVGYDCANCWADMPPAGAGWTIDEVVVAAFPIP